MNKKPKQLSRDEVVEAVREKILTGELVPGQRLVEAELCDYLNASRGTVRTALMDLTHDGLIERIANRGARVRIISLEEALQIVQVRMVVEALCVSLAAERITDKEVGDMRALAEGLKDCAEKSDIEGFAQHTHAIFETYVRIANQPVAADVLLRLRAQSTRHRFRLTYRAGRSKISLPFWVDIVEAICNRQPQAAHDALCRLVSNIEDSMRAVAQEPAPLGRR